jgi:hypothetical protein
MQASLPVVLCLTVGAALLACASRSPTDDAGPPNAELAREGRDLADHLAATKASAGLRAGEGMRVRLAFSQGADLDLYVTDPTYETVYFANSPTRAGGRLEADVRCDAPAPRVETITFPRTLPGAYRVGVDFPERCSGGGGSEAFAVTLEGERVQVAHEGTIDAGHFIPIVLEVIVPAEEIRE